MKFIKQLFAILALLCATQVLAEPQPGKDYKVLNPPQPTAAGGKIEVLEFFFYGCSHCFKLHPLLSAWEKKMPNDVELTYVPAIFNPSWEPMARTLYALEALGQQKQLHDELFNAWNTKIQDLTDEAKITNFVAQRGVDGKKFGEAYNSFSMQSKVVRAKQMGQSYGIRGTPTLVVDGKYLITGLHPPETIEVLNALIDKARKERGGKR
ncbi:MAG: thiol:disulfide interchange protein DsbA/DsbL [Nitrosomonadales bacterium]|nr:thiol:disulfide interchange protein DsbA/DsbL [Nitrosomonadales bacterium]